MFKPPARLPATGSAGLTQRPIPMRNQNHTVIYHQFFASQNKIGERIAGYLFDKHGRE